MDKVINFPSFSNAKIGNMSILKLPHDDGTFGFINFNTFNCSGYQLRGIFFPFFFNSNSYNYDEPCIYGKLHELSATYSQDIIKKGNIHTPVYPSKNKHILIKPPFKLDNPIQKKLLEILDKEHSMMMILNSGQRREYNKSHDKRTFSKFPLSYLEELYGINPNLNEGDGYDFAFEKKFGTPYYRDKFNKMRNSISGNQINLIK